MNVWVVNSEEPIPEITGKGRLLRGGLIADSFSKDKKNNVIWWCSTFLHYEKEFYAQKSVNIDLKRNLHLKMLHTGKAYEKNVSIARIRYCKLLAKVFKKTIQTETKPDVIYCAWPHIELSYECVKYGKKYNIKKRRKNLPPGRQYNERRICENDCSVIGSLRQKCECRF